MNKMLELLQNSKEYTFEKKNSFNHGAYPCFYVKKEFGFVVFILFSDDNIDYIVFDAKKRLITLIENINFYDEKFSIKIIEENSRDEISYPQYIINRNKNNA